MLVIVEDRDFHALAQLLLDIEALRRFNIFEVNAAEGGLQAGNNFYQLIWIVFTDLQIEHIDVGKFLEENTLALHDRLCRQRADISQAQHRCTISNHAHEIGSGSERGHLFRFGNDFLTSRRNPWRIGHGEVILVG